MSFNNNENEIKCIVVDAGARYGAHPSWVKALDIVDYYMFEADGEESDRLYKKYHECSNIYIENKALYSKACTIRFNRPNHKALTTLYEINESEMKYRSYFEKEIQYSDSFEVEAVSLDEYFSNSHEIDFLKLDVEGAELDVLQGCKINLKKSVLGVRSEVQFANVHKNAAAFSDIHNLLLLEGFELLNFDYDGRGAAMSPYTKTDRYGYLISTDAVWIKRRDILFDNNHDKVDVTLKYAMFLLMNNGTDIALSFLCKSVDDGVELSSKKDTKIYKFVKKEIAWLFKSLTYVPLIENEKLYSTFNKLFDEDFPSMNKFYETEL